jgi:hypothetical protein
LGQAPGEFIEFVVHTFSCRLFCCGSYEQTAVR